MEKYQIQAVVRESGTTPKKIRKNGQLPAVMYGNKTQPTNLTVAQNEFEKLLRKAGESSIVELTVNGQVKNVLIHDLQREPVSYKIIHADFLEVSMTETLTAVVQIEFVGEALAVKAHGGTLVKLLSEVDVECLPKDLPHNIEVNIEALATFEDIITVANIKVPAGVKILTDALEAVAKVQPPRDVEAELAQEVGDISQVEGIAEVPAEGAEVEEAKEA